MSEPGVEPTIEGGAVPVPSPFELWQQAAADPERYRELLHQHGLILEPGDDGYDDAPRNLPCGWPGRSEQ
jgi:hypothetical protein